VSELTYMGERPNQGRIVPREPHPGEGFAVLICGGTSVVLSYTILAEMCGDLAEGAHGKTFFMDAARTRHAMHAITSEAANGRMPPEGNS
jgi:hypothetical protein